MNAAVTILTPPALRAYWPGQGGYYAGIRSPGEGQPDYHLIFANPALSHAKGPWGKYGKKISGADSYHDGLANTKAMAAAGTAIAQVALAATIEGHSDWHIMSLADAHLLAANCKDMFKDKVCWTSTQYSAGSAWIQHFYNGLTYVDYKDFEAEAVFVRRLILQSFDTAPEGSKNGGVA